jgi:hypothetical protein
MAIFAALRFGAQGFLTVLLRNEPRSGEDKVEPLLSGRDDRYSNYIEGSWGQSCGKRRLLFFA